MTWLGLPVWAWGLGCLAVAGVFARLAPRTEAAGWRGWLARWGHALVWVLLAGMCLLWALGLGALGNLLGLAAGLTYLAFLSALLSLRQTGRR